MIINNTMKLGEWRRNQNLSTKFGELSVAFPFVV